MLGFCMVENKSKGYSFYRYLINEGYYFNKEIIENYLLSLKVKPFVILTGNSGTGKTKLSQLFAKFLSEGIIEEEGVTTEVRVGKSSTSGGWSISRKVMEPLIPIMDLENEKHQIVIDGIPDEGKFNLNTRLFFNSDEVRRHLAKLREEDPDQKISLEIKINKEIDSGYQIVPVGANWTDNTNIIGYYNAITEQYQSTPTFDLINEASNDLNTPYFLILDEMNLSHVERYFADFLSAIESEEPIPIFGKSNESLTLPNNLFIIGTVNVDETTYMFSPKVLDRANTIEFDTLSVSDYINLNLEDNDFEGDISYLQSPLIDSDISNLNISDLKEILSGISCSDGNLLEVLTNELDSFQYSLKSTGFDFGFRVINEILRFMVVAWRYENSPDDWDNWERYFDAQIKQKILPKLHGSQKAIGNVLDNLFNLCLVDWDNNEQAKLFDITEDNCKYYTSALKLQNMSKVLSDQRYVSFIN